MRRGEQCRFVSAKILKINLFDFYNAFFERIALIVD